MTMRKEDELTIKVFKRIAAFVFVAVVIVLGCTSDIGNEKADVINTADVMDAAPVEDVVDVEEWIVDVEDTIIIDVDTTEEDTLPDSDQ